MGFPFEAILDETVQDRDDGRILAASSASRPPRQTWDVLAGAGLGDTNPNTVKVFTPTGPATPSRSTPTRPESGAVTCRERPGRGRPGEIVTGAGPGTVFGPHTRGFDRAGLPLQGLSFFAYSTLRYGVNVAASRLDGGAYDRILTGAGPGAVFGPHVRAFRYTGSAVQAMSKVSFFGYGTLKFGVDAGGGDVDQDGFGEILWDRARARRSGRTMRGFDYDEGAVTAIRRSTSTPGRRPDTGALVAGGDVDADARNLSWSRRVPDRGLGPDVRGYRFAGSVSLLGIDFAAYPSGQFGARVGAGDLAGDARQEDHRTRARRHRRVDRPRLRLRPGGEPQASSRLPTSWRLDRSPTGSTSGPTSVTDLHVVLVEPQIHWNTGNAGRSCLAAGAQLHLVEPLGFSLDAPQVARAGLDYWVRVKPRVWPSFDAIERALPDLGSPWFFTAEARRDFWDVAFDGPTVLVFGCESVGLPMEIRQRHDDRLVRFPMKDPLLRALNLSTSVGLALYEVLRQRRLRDPDRPG
ncbi:MAG: tRNA (cytidine(34)-2'-O)-methyltransferase [Acidobacteriota bacterium]